MSIRLGDAVVLIRGDNSRLRGDLNSAERETSSVMQRLGGSIQTAVGNMLASFGMRALDAVAYGVRDMITGAAGLENTIATFDRLVDSVGGDAVDAMNQLRDATQGMVSDGDLMQAGNRFLAMGLADSTEEAASLAEMATQLGMAMGEDATGSMENFALMLANQSIQRLDSFGISSSAVRERIDELMESTEGLTREQAFMQAVMEQGQITMGRVGEQGNSTAANLARFQATTQNLKDQIGAAFLPALNAILTPLAELATQYGPSIIAWAQSAGEWLGENLPTAIENIKYALENISAFIRTVVPIIRARIRSFRDAGVALIEGLRDGIRERWEAILTWFREQVERLPRAIREALGIASPSKVTMGIGAQMAAGLAQGFTSGIDNLQPALNATVGGMAGGMSSVDNSRSVGGITNNIGSRIDVDQFGMLFEEYAGVA